MKIKKVLAQAIKNSVGEGAIEIIINKDKKRTTSAPVGKSTGKFEARAYKNSLNSDINTINKIIGKNKELKNIEISEFSDLTKIEKLTKNKIGANSLYALETSVLKLLAKEENVELYQLFNKTRKIKMPCLVGNAIGGGLHSSLGAPDFQEFLFIPETSIKESIEINKKALEDCKTILKNLKKFKGIGRENAWQTALENEQVLVLMQDVKENIIDETGIKLHIGIDAAASSFYNNKTKKYVYKVTKKQRTIKQQIEYMNCLIERYKLYYVEDPLEQNDFKGFSEINKINNKKCLIIGDDLTATNPGRLKKAIKNKSINAIIVKPNQIGSLLAVQQVCELAKKNNIKTVFSHRSGETTDTSLADLSILFGADFVKTGISGKEREVKLERLREIENANL